MKYKGCYYIGIPVGISSVAGKVVITLFTYYQVIGWNYHGWIQSGDHV